MKSAASRKLLRPDAHSAVTAVANLFAYTRYEDPDRNLLNTALSEIVALVHRRSGTTSADVWPDGERPW